MVKSQKQILSKETQRILEKEKKKKFKWKKKKGILESRQEF